MMDIGGQRLHLLDSGSGIPAVLLEAGIGASCLNWTAVQTELARLTRVCSYDRASLGWSDPASRPHTTLQLVDELHAMLAAARIPTPLILVGHSFGAVLVQSFAIKYPEQVAGLVLIDPLGAGEWLHPTETQQRILRRGVKLARRGAILARLGVVRASLALLTGGARRVPRLVASLSSGSGESAISRLVGEVAKMPPQTWPMVRAHWSEPKSFQGLAAHLESLPESSRQAEALGALPPKIPLAILSAAHATPQQLADRDAAVSRSAHGRHVIAAGSGHWIHLDEPERVIEAIREMLALVR